MQEGWREGLTKQSSEHNCPLLVLGFRNTLAHGESFASGAFGSPSLASEAEFEVVGLEIWAVNAVADVPTEPSVLRTGQGLLEAFVGGSASCR